jgi:diadenosine tetraphosphate (Ap4A) HIT family hydrolase
MQTVNHLHFHLMGKRLMHWPPGWLIINVKKINIYCC